MDEIRDCNDCSKHIISFSGEKDSTAMLLKMIENKRK